MFRCVSLCFVVLCCVLMFEHKISQIRLEHIESCFLLVSLFLFFFFRVHRRRDKTVRPLDDRFCVHIYIRLRREFGLIIADADSTAATAVVVDFEKEC